MLRPTICNGITPTRCLSCACTTTASTPQLRLDDNAALYDGWAKIYDSDGNVLQQLDAHAFADTVVPLLQDPSSATNRRPPMRILELGCGTGRNTVLIKKHAPPGSTIFASDLSAGMMQEARRKIREVDEKEGGRSGLTAPSVDVRWALIDLQTQEKELQAFLAGPEQPQSDSRVDALISTLVLEHVALDAFFSVIASALKVGGWAWVTDMHPDMGSSRAAFRTEDGTKVSGISFMHSIEDTLAVAAKYGLVVDGEVDCRGVGDDEEAVLSLYGVRAKKWVGKKMLLGMLFRKVGTQG